MEFTQEQVYDAWAARRIDEEAGALGVPAEEVIRELYALFDLTGDFRQAKREQYARGQVLLASAMLVATEPVAPRSREAMQVRTGLAAASVGAMVEVMAGDGELVRYVGLARRMN